MKTWARPYFDQLNNVYQQNVFLKYLLLIGAIITVALLLTVIVLAKKKPVLVYKEQGRIYLLSNTESYDRVNNEAIKLFANNFITERYSFDKSNVKEKCDSSYKYLSVDAKNKVLAEDQKAVSFVLEKSLTQITYPTNFDIKDLNVKVLCDRIINVSGLKAVVPITIEMKLATAKSTVDNPYGLIIEQLIETSKSKQMELEK